MAISKRAPNTILLAGKDRVIVENEIVAGEAITPGHLVELYDDSGTTKWRKHATATEIATLAVALDQIELNKGIGDAYAAGDAVKAAFLTPGCVFFGLIPSGQNISNGEFLQSNGDGTFVTASATTQDAALAKFQSLDNPGSVAVATRVRIQVVQ